MGGAQQIKANQVEIRQCGAQTVEGQAITVRQGGIVQARAQDIALVEGGLLFAETQTATLTASQAGAILAGGEVTLDQSMAKVVLTRGDVKMDQSGSGVIVARQVSTGQNTGAILVIAGRVDGPVNAVFGPAASAAFGAAFALVIGLMQSGKPAVMEAAMAKLYLSECFVQSSLDAVRTFGGYGYMSEMEVERDLRDSIRGTLYSGTSDIQRMIIARWLGL